MMSKAIQQRNFEVNIDHHQNFSLVLYFQLNKGVSLKGEFDLGRPLHFDDIKEFHCVYRLFLFDIFKVFINNKYRRQKIRKGCASSRSKRLLQGEEAEEHRRQSTRRVLWRMSSLMVMRIFTEKRRAVLSTTQGRSVCQTNRIDL